MILSFYLKGIFNSPFLPLVKKKRKVEFEAKSQSLHSHFFVPKAQKNGTIFSIVSTIVFPIHHLDSTYYFIKN